MSDLLVPPRSRKSIRILAFSDWRGQDYENLLQLIERVPDYDVILYGGDDLDRMVASQEVVQQIVEQTATKRLLFVAGNDDEPMDKRILAKADYSHDLHEEPFFYKSFAFFGIEGTTDGLGLIIHSEAQVKETLNKHMQFIKQKKGRRKLLPIVVSHAPPRDVLDMAMRHAVLRKPREIGSTSLREFLDVNRVPLTICGHVHLFGGRQETLPNKNLIINTASHDNPGSEGKIAVIDLSPSGRAEVCIFTTHVLIRDHPLGRLQHVGDKRIRQLLQNGIKDLEDIIPENKAKLRLPSCGERHIRIWIRQAELIRSGFVGIEVLDRDKLAFLEGGHFVVWDIETDLNQSHIWLIGALDTKTGERKQFFNPDDEKTCIKEFVSWMAERPAATPISFSNFRFDPNTLRKSLERHDVKDTVDVCTRDVDLCNRLLYYCAHTYPTVKVKDLAQHLGYKFRHPDLDGFSVGAMFSRYLRTGRAPSNWDPYLEYNDDDVGATHLILSKVSEAYFEKK